MKKRVFVGADLSDVVKDEFTRFFKGTSRIEQVKWEKAEKLHLTLVFLGFVEEEKVPKIWTILKNVLVGVSPFSLAIIPKIEGFPKASNPRVIFLPLQGEVAKLRKIAESLKRALRARRFLFDDREFTAHLTIGRFRGGSKKWQKERVLKEVADILPKSVLEFEISGITLYESILTPRGSVYKKLHYENFGH